MIYKIDCQWRLCLLISEDLCPAGDWWRVVQSITASNAGTTRVVCIQLREKSIDDCYLLERAKRLVALCRPRRIGVLINDRPDIAMLVGADGVHLGQTDLPCAQVRQLVGPKMIIGVSTSQLSQAKRAVCQGANYCGVGPMFSTATKPKDTLPGPAYLKRYLAWNKLPHLAIGGITMQNIDELVQAGVRGVAVSRAVCSAANPGQVVAKILERLNVS